MLLCCCCCCVHVFGALLLLLVVEECLKAECSQVEFYVACQLHGGVECIVPYEEI